MSTATSTAPSTATYASLVGDATTRYLDIAGRLGGIATTAAEAVKGLAEQLPVASVPAALPTAAEVLTTNFAVAERLLAAQKAFALQLVESVPAPAVAVPQQVKPATAKASANA